MVAVAINAPVRRDWKPAPRVPANRNSMAALFARLDAGALAAIADAAINELDRRTPDSDIEPNGDEMDGSGGAEDEFQHHNESYLAYPGCPVSDPGGDDAERLPIPGYGDDQSRGPIGYRGQEAHQ